MPSVVNNEEIFGISEVVYELHGLAIKGKMRFGGWNEPRFSLEAICIVEDFFESIEFVLDSHLIFLPSQQQYMHALVPRPPFVRKYAGRCL
jgi:hypothetical protein